MSVAPTFQNVSDFKAWFESHVTLAGQPYTLDLDQARAVYDNHKNTLVTARAGSGKTRVIVAKVAYLIASGQAELDEIAAFMFNRTAAVEVNERIGGVAIDGIELRKWGGQPREINIASTFHKFALDSIKACGEHPQLISEGDQAYIIRRSVTQSLQAQHRRMPLQEFDSTLKLISSFIVRAGQQFPGPQGFEQLCNAVDDYCNKHANDPHYDSKIQLHQLAITAYHDYLQAFSAPHMDFNMLMAHATELLQLLPQQDATSLAAQPNTTSSAPTSTPSLTEYVFNPAQSCISQLKYILVDEYQDFSYLFYSIIQAIRSVCPAAHLFAVGDDWQAINRFAGSNVDYFIDFLKYFPEDAINIPLMTNYRSDRQVVENANRYMLENYDYLATKAIPFSKKNGKIHYINPSKTRFNQGDIYEDTLGDARYQIALADACGGQPAQYADAARLLKTVARIVKKHPRTPVMLLHRHNFTTYQGVTLDGFYQALQAILIEQKVLSAADFQHNIRALTMHRSKGLESDVVILLEVNEDVVLAEHPHATMFEIFGDTLAAAKADQYRLLYVALTRAKHDLYILSTDKKCPVA